MRILLVSQMYPGPDDPDLGAFVARMEEALQARGHEIDRVVVHGRGGGNRRYVSLARRARAARGRRRPDVVYAHFLFPTGLVASFADAPLVVTAHGQDVRNVGTIRGVAAATRLVVRRAAAVVAVSDYLRRELERKVPQAVGKTTTVSMGVDLERFRVTPLPRGGTSYVCIGRLTDRKNVLRLARAFSAADDDEATLTFVGDGPHRARLERQPGIRVTGAVPHAQIPEWVARSHVVCQPSLLEPFGLAALEGMACGRTVVATRNGGPPEFVPPEAGILVDPLDEAALADALRAAARFPRPNDAARAAAAAHDVNEQARRVEEILARAVRATRRPTRGRPA
jgi:glycosyltransferase involved in cell wall biosynthesis